MAAVGLGPTTLRIMRSCQTLPVLTGWVLTLPDVAGVAAHNAIAPRLFQHSFTIGTPSLEPHSSFENRDVPSACAFRCIDLLYGTPLREQCAAAVTSSGFQLNAIGIFKHCPVVLNVQTLTVHYRRATMSSLPTSKSTRARHACPTLYKKT